MSKKQKETVKYNNTLRIAKRKMFVYLKSIGIKRKDSIKEWNYIYEFSIIVNKQIEDPNKEKCKKWLYNEYLSQELEPLKLVEYGFYSSTPWIKLRNRVFEAYGYKCMNCESEDFLHIDHIKPRSLYKELELDFDNMQVLCRSCNSRKSNRIIVDYRKKVFQADR